MSTPLPSRIAEIIDARVFTFAQGAQRHFATNDLVVLLDFREAKPALEAAPRKRLAEAEELPLDVRLQLSQPASALLDELGSPEQSFWFLVVFEDGDFEYGAVNAAMLDAG
ncbi:hypothetical protein [Acidovorax sp. CCYZU-2555]|uniref:hypothetical protein n=1 Tax=Acidovorax sp. CCYZU-2555 TaxID=2835042 RepID=UPI001BCEE2DC|nr:hypothetical protein [Acidovorax sp. CCYZU-2555]MBS7779878.1 hypothetical protein [Acidovorax sp. CCYZU-2555]